MRSKMPPGRKAASEPMTIAAVSDERHGDDREQSVQTKACSTTSIAGRGLAQAVAEVEVQHVPT